MCDKCECCHLPDHGACSDFEAGMNGRCVYCDHAQDCHPGSGDTFNMPLGIGGMMEYYNSLKRQRTIVLQTLRIARRRGQDERIADLRLELCAVRRLIRDCFEAQAVEQAVRIVEG